MANQLPVILTIGGYDPTGGAGVTADIETITSLRCHPITLITCLTSQNTKKFDLIEPVNIDVFISQADLLLSDFKIDVIKIGALANDKIVEETKRILNKLKDTKIVIDPVIETTTGGLLTNKPTLQALKELIFPMAYLLTPNLAEAKVLSGKDDLNQIVEELSSVSSNYLLIKDIDKSNKEIVSHLYSNKELKKSWSTPKIPGSFHGTGCHLASSISCFLAHSKSLEESIELGQKNTIKAINGSVKLGKGQSILKGK
tara:strand:- start:190 stop:960 length:771 start_codon:yes stop_codon:yes gene_type:complete